MRAKYIGMKAQHRAISRKTGGATKGRIAPRSKPKTKAVVIHKRRRAYQRSNEIRSRGGRGISMSKRGRSPTPAIKKKDVGADIPFMSSVSKGKTTKQKTARVSIPKSLDFVLFGVLSVKPKKKKSQKRDEAPLGTKKRGRKKIGVFIS